MRKEPNSIKVSEFNILERKVSLFANATATTNPKHLTIGVLLDNIKTGEYKDIVLKARNIFQLKGKVAYTEYKKKNIPGATLSAYCKHRKKDELNGIEKLIYHTGILQIDIDEIPDNYSHRELKEILQRDNYTLSCFDSLSNLGLKIVILIDGKRHQESFRKAEKYYNKTYNLKIDPATKDIYRLCFVSFDPDLFINPNAEIFLINDTDPVNEISAPVNTQLKKTKHLERGTDTIRHEKWKQQAINNCINLLRNAKPDERHNIRLKVAYLAGGFVEGGMLAENEILPLIFDESDNIAEGQVTNKKEIEAIMDSFQTGKLKPITYEMKEKELENWILKNNFSQGLNEGKKISVEAQQFEPDENFILDCLGKDEYGDASLLTEIFKESKLYDHQDKMWLSYENGVWKNDEKQKFRIQAIDSLTQVYKSLYNNISNNINEVEKKSQIKEIKNDIPELKKNVTELFKRLKKLNTKNRITNVLELCSSILSVQSSEFDVDPYLLNLQNGTYELKNNLFREHKSSDILKKIAGTYFDKNATCPNWLIFLDKIFESKKELMTFVQQISGIWLSGTTDSQIIIFAYGTGANGKTTLFKTFEMLLNDYYQSFDIKTLLQTNFLQSNNEYYLSQLQGKRLVVASEIPKGRQLNESLTKHLTGGEKVNARNPFGRPFNFESVHKIVIFGNYKPIINDISRGFWRRIKLIQFNVSIPEKEQRKQSELLDEFRKELPGILNWCLKGWRIYQANGLIVPDIVEVATKEYQIESDIIAEFLEEDKEKFTIEPTNNGIHIKAEIFYNEFIKWCNVEQEEHQNPFNNKRQFYIALREKSFEVKKYTGNKMYIFGIKLKNDKQQEY